MMYEVHRPCRRGRDRHRAAGRRPQQRARRPRQGRVAAAAVEQVDGERYEQGSRIKAVITEVRSRTKGLVILSRRDPELIKTLFEIEVPEIADGLVEIRGVAREPGYRSKIAVESHAQGVDPVGACVGRAGRASAWSCPSCAERRSTSSRGTGAGAVRRQGAVARARARGVPRRRPEGSDGDRSRRPARARDRQGGHERPPRRAADGLEGGHPVRARVRAGRGRGGIRRRRGRRGVLGSLRCDPRERQALPERGCRAPVSAVCLRTRSSRRSRRRRAPLPRGPCSPSPRRKRPPKPKPRPRARRLRARSRSPKPELPRKAPRAEEQGTVPSGDSPPDPGEREEEAQPS